MNFQVFYCYACKSRITEDKLKVVKLKSGASHEYCLSCYNQLLEKLGKKPQDSSGVSAPSKAAASTQSRQKAPGSSSGVRRAQPGGEMSSAQTRRMVPQSAHGAKASATGRLGGRPKGRAVRGGREAQEEKGGRYGRDGQTGNKQTLLIFVAVGAVVLSLLVFLLYKMATSSGGPMSVDKKIERALNEILAEEEQQTAVPDLILKKYESVMKNAQGTGWQETVEVRMQIVQMYMKGADFVASHPLDIEKIRGLLDPLLALEARSPWKAKADALRAEAENRYTTTKEAREKERAELERLANENPDKVQDVIAWFRRTILEFGESDYAKMLKDDLELWESHIPKPPEDGGSNDGGATDGTGDDGAGEDGVGEDSAEENS